LILLASLPQPPFASGDAVHHRCSLSSPLLSLSGAMDTNANPLFKFQQSDDASNFSGSSIDFDASFGAHAIAAPPAAVL